MMISFLAHIFMRVTPHNMSELALAHRDRCFWIPVQETRAVCVRKAR